MFVSFSKDLTMHHKYLMSSSFLTNKKWSFTWPPLSVGGIPQSHYFRSNGSMCMMQRSIARGQSGLIPLPNRNGLSNVPNIIRASNVLSIALLWNPLLTLSRAPAKSRLSTATQVFFTCYTAFMVIVLTLVGKTVIANIAKIYILQGVLSLVRKSIAKGIFQNATL